MGGEELQMDEPATVNEDRTKRSRAPGTTAQCPSDAELREDRSSTELQDITTMG